MSSGKRASGGCNLQGRLVPQNHFWEGTAPQAPMGKSHSQGIRHEVAYVPQPLWEGQHESVDSQGRDAASSVGTSRQ
jgi:hypothetical protein